MVKFFGGSLNFKSKPVIAAVAACAAAVLLLVALAVYTYAHGDIFPGVTGGGISLGGMNREEAVSALDARSKTQYEGAKLEIKLEDIVARTVSAEELGVSLSSGDMADAALAIGHEGGFFSRIGDVISAIFAGREAEGGIAVDESALAKVISELSAHDVAPVDASYELTDKELVLYPKADGKKLDAEGLAKTVRERFSAQDYSAVEVARVTAESKGIDMDTLYSEVHKEVSDARLEKQDKENVIVPHVVGVDFDLESARIAYEKSPGEVLRIPLQITQPKVYTKTLEAGLFKDVLADVTTRFSPKKVARTANVRLAAKLVNGKVLNPGEEFSYNTTVGPRTKARGFQEAAIFASGEVVDGVGGGICQVSSTLYMAAIQANMQITERKNHSFYVDYAPKGEDATVVYGSIDFRFKNTSPYPIKIVATSKDNYIRIKLMGTETDKFTVKLSKKTLSTRPFEERVRYVNTLAEGKRSIEQKGQEGLVMEVYRKVYDESGKLISSSFENKSSYKPMPQIVHVGTAAVTEETPSVPATSETETVPPAEEAPSETEKESGGETEATEAELEEGNQAEGEEAPDWLVTDGDAGNPQ